MREKLREKKRFIFASNKIQTERLTDDWTGLFRIPQIKT